MGAIKNGLLLMLILVLGPLHSSLRPPFQIFRLSNKYKADCTDFTACTNSVFSFIFLHDTQGKACFYLSIYFNAVHKDKTVLHIGTKYSTERNLIFCP